MNKRIREQGAALLVVVIILAVAVLGLLGFVLWQNFFAKGSQTNTTSQTSTPAKSDQPKEVSLSQTATESYGGHTATVKYPDSWKYEKNTDVAQGSITSADGKTIVRFTMAPPQGIGGTCGDESQPVVDPVKEASWAAINGVPVALFSSRIVEYSDSGMVMYYFGAVKNTEAIKNVKTGDSACPVFIFSNFIQLDDDSGAVFQAYVIFKDLYMTDVSAQRDNLTIDEVKTAFSSVDAGIAEKIIESITIK